LRSSTSIAPTEDSSKRDSPCLIMTAVARSHLLLVQTQVVQTLSRSQSFTTAHSPSQCPAPCKQMDLAVKGRRKFFPKVEQCMFLFTSFIAGDSVFITRFWCSLRSQAIIKNRTILSRSKESLLHFLFQNGAPLCIMEFVSQNEIKAQFIKPSYLISTS
jgi:hypothetical protein